MRSNLDNGGRNLPASLSELSSCVSVGGEVVVAMFNTANDTGDALIGRTFIVSP